MLSNDRVTVITIVVNSTNCDTILPLCQVSSRSRHSISFYHTQYPLTHTETVKHTDRQTDTHKDITKCHTADMLMIPGAVSASVLENQESRRLVSLQAAGLYADVLLGRQIHPRVLLPRYQSAMDTEIYKCIHYQYDNKFWCLSKPHKNHLTFMRYSRTNHGEFLGKYGEDLV